MRSSRGLSLPELLIAVGILAILAAVSMPLLLGAIENSDLNTAVRQVAGDARYARSLAVSRGLYYRLHAGRDPVVGDPSTVNRYRIERRDPISGWPAVGAQQGSSADVITNWQYLSNPSLSNLSRLYYGRIAITSVVDGSSTAVDGVIFNSSGASVGPWNSPTTVRSVNITLQRSDGTGPTKVIQIDPVGNVKMP